MSNPSQEIKFDVTTKATGAHHVEYWNNDYPGGLHYKATVACNNINSSTHEARFMFQIPAGHPGLSGQYVVVYVKEGQNKAQNLYGHAATSDLVTATTWCNTGSGFTPTMYQVTKGHIEVE